MADRAQGIRWLSEAVGEIARLYDARAIPSNANRALIEGLVRRAVEAIFPDGSPERDAYAAFKLGSVGVAFARDPRVAMRNALGTAKNDLDSLLRKADSVSTDAATEPAVAIPERVPMTHSVGPAGFQATVFRVLIASPGDAVADRETVRQAIYDWNDLHAVQRRIVLLPVMWETHSLPKLGGRPQGLLNDQFVDDVDLVLAVFRTRLGQPTGEAESGTLEEIERCLAAGKHVGAYFSNEAVPIEKIDGEQISRLAAFKQRVKAQGILGGYETQPELRRKITADLTKLMYEVPRAEITIAKPLAPTNQVESEGEESDDRPEHMVRLERLVDEIVLDWETERDGSHKKVENGKEIMSTLKRELQDLLVEYKGDIARPVAATLKAHMNTAKRLEDFFLTFGSHSTFWSLGSVLLAYLGALARSESEVRLQNGVFEFAWDIAGPARPMWSRDGDKGAPSVEATLRVRNLNQSTETIQRLGVANFVAQHAFLKNGAWAQGECEIQPDQEVTFRLSSHCEARTQGKEELLIPVALNLASGQGPIQGVWFVWTDSFDAPGS